MNRDFPWRIVFSTLSLIICAGLLPFLTSYPAHSADFHSSLKVRWDEGDEVDPYLIGPTNFPDNLTERKYFEGLFTAELLFSKPPVGKRLRLGLRMLEYQPSRIDGLLYGF